MKRQNLSLLLFVTTISFFLVQCKSKSEGSQVLADSYPNCPENAIDPDGDGWGWDPIKEESCRMETLVAEAPVGSLIINSPCAYEESYCSLFTDTCRVYSSDGTRPELKTEIWQTMYDLNKNKGEAEAECRADLAVAMAMQEAHSFTIDGNGNLPYDYLKDSRTDGAQNVSLFNMNIDFIKRSCQSNCGAFQDFNNPFEKMYLNQRAFLKEAVRRLSEGFDYYGIDETLHFHRGGYTGWVSPGVDEREFARSQKAVANHLRKYKGFRSNGVRVSHSIYQR